MTSPVPPRGYKLLPQWMTVQPRGWVCAHPGHAVGEPTEAGDLPAHLVMGRVLDHLNAYHPGWKLPCRACGRPQWNDEGSMRCFDCRTTF